MQTRVFDSPAKSNRRKLTATPEQMNPIEYSLRRQYVDDFYTRHVPMLPDGSRVLDLGGKRHNKRGGFDIEAYPLCTYYANIDAGSRPDVLADAVRLPFPADCFDAVICSELLEHVPTPPTVLCEAYRVLRAGGVLLACVPFLTRMHGDPCDYGRYTDYYWRERLAALGFTEMTIEKQGLFWSVLVDILRALVYQWTQERRPCWGLYRRLARRLIAWGRRQAWRRDAKSCCAQHPFYGSFTTGFGMVARK